MLGAACVESVNGLHCGEEQNVPDGGGIGQEHDDPVDAETYAAGGGHSVFECSNEVFINGHCLIVAFCFFLRLLFETRTLVDGVIQLAEPAMKSSKRSTIPGLSGLRFVSGETSTG